MDGFDLPKFQTAIASGRIEWRKHVLQKLIERGISQDAVRDVLLTGDRIREYPEDKPFPSALFLGYFAERPLHVVASYDESVDMAYVITAYEPSLEIFEPDFRTKRKK